MLETGQKAPDFTVLANDLSEVTLVDSAGKVRLLSVIPSIDTSTCDAQTRRFNEEAVNFNDDIVVLTISADLPFAQRRWCGNAGVDRVETLSCHKDMAFADDYHVHNTKHRLCKRAIFIVDKEGTLRYTEYVDKGPVDFDAALAALKEVAEG